MRWTVSANGSKDEVKASIRRQAAHPGIDQALSSLVDTLEGSHANVTASGSHTTLTVSASGWSEAEDEVAA